MVVYTVLGRTAWNFIIVHFILRTLEFGVQLYHQKFHMSEIFYFQALVSMIILVKKKKPDRTGSSKETSLRTYSRDTYQSESRQDIELSLSEVPTRTSIDSELGSSQLNQSTSSWKMGILPPDQFVDQKSVGPQWELFFIIWTWTSMLSPKLFVSTQHHFKKWWKELYSNVNSIPCSCSALG